MITTSEQSNLDDNIPEQTPDHDDQRYISSNTSIRHSTSTILHLKLPNPGVAALIFNRGKYFSLPFHLRQQPGGTPPTPISRREKLVQVSKLPKPQDHPIHFARKLIQLTLSLQGLDVSDRPDICLDQPVHDAARRFMETAAMHVTSHDSLVSSLDGLETLMLEACYHINSGYLSGAFLSFRRALATAQLINVPRLAERPGTREDSVWFRLMYGDRFMSLILGLPCAIAEDTFAQKYQLVTDCATEQLDRVHFAVLGRIIARNVRMQRFRRNNASAIGGPDDDGDGRETQAIDHELKTAARRLSLKWWASVDLNSCTLEVEAIETTGRLVAQMHHYFLLAALHLPILMQEVLTGPVSTASPFSVHMHSETTILAASREVLTRFVTLRTIHRTLSYRAMDDKAYIVALGLVLVHLNGHRRDFQNMLEHQRPFDLGLVHKMIDTMKNCSCFDENKLGRKDVASLESLLEIEANAADGHSYYTWMDEDRAEGQVHVINNMEDGLRLPIHFFGTLCIHREELQRPVPGLDLSWTVEAAAAITPTTKHTFNDMNDVIFPGNTLHVFEGEMVDFLHPRISDDIFDSWIPGENALDQTIIDIGS